ncbi:MAG TPA: PAS domain-containing protein [Bacteroidota bacterium]|nr:PAS domain-containing protein [Bacteroidota bacterium]
MALLPHIAERLLDVIPEMCFVVSTKQVVLYCNDQARRLLALSAESLGTVRFDTLLAPESPRPRLQISSAGPEPPLEVQFMGADGTIIDAVLTVGPPDRNDGDHLYVFARDVSLSKQRELDLLRFSNVVHYTVNPIQITDSQGAMVYVNPAFERASGYSKEELIGRNPNILSSKKYPKEFWRRIWKVISAGNVWQGEVENRRKSGDPLFTQLLISPIIGSDGQVVGYLGSHRDITEQKALEQQLMHSQKMESIGTLAAGIAHEVGNPLASISSIVQVLQRTIQDDFAKDKLGLVESQVHRITKIIRDLVDFSRPSNYQVIPTDIVKNLSDAVEIVKMGKKGKDVTFLTHIRMQIPLLYLVPDQLSQVFINILLNAVDALQGKRGTIVSEVQRDEELVRITIVDDGKGIQPEHLSKIFEPFFTTKRVGEGTGLGLWVSYGIMKSFGGDITVESEWGRGTKFTILLPLNAQEYQRRSA